LTARSTASSSGDHDREARDLQRAAELGPADVEDLGEQRRNRLSLDGL